MIVAELLEVLRELPTDTPVHVIFDGVEMFYHGQRPEQWWNEFHERIGRGKEAICDGR